ncbi:hypothetical protein KC338_g179 [Hortaea werneckii]|nr:hypothetical protein KC338_g179 [Hortaea werneckii]
MVSCLPLSRPLSVHPPYPSAKRPALADTAIYAKSRLSKRTRLQAVSCAPTTVMRELMAAYTAGQNNYLPIYLIKRPRVLKTALPYAVHHPLSFDLITLTRRSICHTQNRPSPDAFLQLLRDTPLAAGEEFPGPSTLSTQRTRADLHARGLVGADEDAVFGVETAGLLGVAAPTADVGLGVAGSEVGGALIRGGGAGQDGEEVGPGVEGLVEFGGGVGGRRRTQWSFGLPNTMVMRSANPRELQGLEGPALTSRSGRACRHLVIWFGVNLRQTRTPTAAPLHLFIVVCAATRSR